MYVAYEIFLVSPEQLLLKQVFTTHSNVFQSFSQKHSFKWFLHNSCFTKVLKFAELNLEPSLFELNLHASNVNKWDIKCDFLQLFLVLSWLLFFRKNHGDSFYSFLLFSLPYQALHNSFVRRSVLTLIFFIILHMKLLDLL